MTTSLQVAEVFGKQHKHVLDAIDDLKGVAENSADLFHESTYEHPQNKQEYRMFYMNCDAFTLLAMGFTGKKAMKFKLEYINQFNKMEEQLKSKVDTVSSYMIDDPIKRAEQWISEQKEKALLAVTIEKQTEVITHKSDVIEGLTDSVSLAEKRQILSKVIRKGCYNNLSNSPP